ncbi:MAG: hypothetical protein M3377_03325, partial [Actinomycetota bacterium]|nr:hypothetical protein [Actinomycetota bacterium]
MSPTGPSRPGIFYEPRGRARLDARRTRRRRIGLWVARAALAAVVFFLGVALGRALEETPRPGGTQTLIRTLEPETLPPVTRILTVTT